MTKASREAITVNLIRLCGMDKHKARECADVVLQMLEADKREPLSDEQCRAKFEAWYESAPDAEPEPERTYELSDESMSELTKDCIWLGWQAAHNIKAKP